MRAASLAAALPLLWCGTLRVHAEALSDARYLALVTQYARGERAAAVAALEDMGERELVSGIQSLQDHAPQLLRAAVMLHTDRHDLERHPALGSEGEPLCSSRLHDRLAEHAVQHLLQDTGGRAFARRWYLAMAFQEQWGRCVQAALEWTEAGLRWFPGDAELLLERGTLEELFAILPSPAATRTLSTAPGVLHTQPQDSARQEQEERYERRRHLASAQRSLQRAVVADPGLAVARLRLGRVLWRLGDPRAAREALESVGRGAEPALRRLVHLFLGRIHEDARELEAALLEYRAALELDPTSQVAAVALAHALQLGGEPAAAREALEHALAHGGRRTDTDPFWEYPMGDSRSHPQLLDALRDEATRP